MFDDVEENIKNSKAPNAVSGHLFQMNMLRGLAENGCDISVVNIPRIRRYPDYKQVLFHKTRFKTEFTDEAVSIGFINLQGFNYLTQIYNTYLELKKIVQMNLDKKIVLLVFNTYPAPIIAIRKIKKQFPEVIVCDVVGDISGQYGLKKEKSLHGKLLDYVLNKLDKMASECDAFALATDNIAKALKIEHKPYVVIEGMYEILNTSDNATQTFQTSDEEKIIFYAGAVLKEYGIEHLLKAFSLIKQDKYKLLIAGNGDAVDLVKDYAKDDNRIKYLGMIPPSEVSKYQKMATVLVNPRTGEHEYVKYSFASKNLECLASGVPYVAHKLECNPKEYDQYIQYPRNETDRALADKLIEVTEFSLTERRRIGITARIFICQQKNPKIQMGKLHKLLSEF